MDPDKILHTDYIDLIFKGRNHKYGSYELRKKYRRRMLLAGFITIGTMVLICAANLIHNAAQPTDTATAPSGPIVIADLPPPPPPPPPPEIRKPKKGAAPAPPTKPSKSFTAIKVVPNDKVPASQKPNPPKPKDDEVVAAHNNGGSDKPDAKDPDLKPSGKGSKKSLGDDDQSDDGTRKDIMAVQQLASFPGGMAALYKYINDNIRYPSGAMEQNIQGQVVVEFVVAANGKVSSMVVIRDLGYGTAAEAMRVLADMPKWTPAKQNGQPIPSYFTLPVTFKLQ